MAKIKAAVAKERVERARSRVGMRTEYVLGKGGFLPNEDSPGRQCDCSGFAAWVMHLSRKPKPSRPWWIETTNVYRDATGLKTTFTKLDAPEEGCFVVYGDKGGHQGHIGVVTEVKDPRTFDVVDCSLGSWRREQDAIQERSGAFFRSAGGIFVCLKQDLA